MLARPARAAWVLARPAWVLARPACWPGPQEGCEKFVLKFPQKVLLSFVKSFPAANLANAATVVMTLQAIDAKRIWLK